MQNKKTPSNAYELVGLTDDETKTQEENKGYFTSKLFRLLVNDLPYLDNLLLVFKVKAKIEAININNDEEKAVANENAKKEWLEMIIHWQEMEKICGNTPGLEKVSFVFTFCIENNGILCDFFGFFSVLG